MGEKTTDGAWVAFWAESAGAVVLRVLEVGTGTVRTVGDPTGGSELGPVPELRWLEEPAASPAVAAWWKSRSCAR